MVIGRNNIVSKSLAETIGVYFPGEFIVLNSEFEQQLQEIKHPPKYVFVNLMDVNQPEEVVQKVREYFPDAYITGIHSYDSKVLVDQILAQGYHHFISIFNLATELPKLLHSA